MAPGAAHRLPTRPGRGAGSVPGRLRPLLSRGVPCRSEGSTLFPAAGALGSQSVPIGLQGWSLSSCGGTPRCGRPLGRAPSWQEVPHSGPLPACTSLPRRGLLLTLHVSGQRPARAGISWAPGLIWGLHWMLLEPPCISPPAPSSVFQWLVQSLSPPTPLDRELKRAGAEWARFRRDPVPARRWQDVQSVSGGSQWQGCLSSPGWACGFRAFPRSPARGCVEARAVTSSVQERGPRWGESRVCAAAEPTTTFQAPLAWPRLAPGWGERWAGG